MKEVIVADFNKIEANELAVRDILVSGRYSTIENYNKYKALFDEANEYATNNFTCMKVQVGSLFLYKDKDGTYRRVVSCNCNPEYNCREHNECYKAKVTGIYESREETRKFCKAIHSEINMIGLLKKYNIDPASGILFVTRYPCTNCMTECAKFGFKHICFAGSSRGTSPDEIEKIANDNGIIFEHFLDIDYEFA